MHQYSHSPSRRSSNPHPRRRIHARNTRNRPRLHLSTLAPILIHCRVSLVPLRLSPSHHRRLHDTRRGSPPHIQQSNLRLRKRCVVLVSFFGSFGLAISSVFAYNQREPVNLLIGGLGNASQVYVIILLSMMNHRKREEHEVRGKELRNLLMSQHLRDRSVLIEFISDPIRIDYSAIRITLFLKLFSNISLTQRRVPLVLPPCTGRSILLLAEPCQLCF